MHFPVKLGLGGRYTADESTMKQLTKKLLHRSMVVLCVLLAGIVVAMWNRSYQRADRLHWVQWQERDRQASVHMSGFDTGLGSVQYLREQLIWTDNPDEIRQLQDAVGRFQPNGQPYRSSRPPRALVSSNGDSLMTALGFDYRQRGPDELSAGRMRIVIPYWFIFCLIMAYPVTHYIRGVLQRSRVDQQARNLCPRCGELLATRATHCACCDRPVVVVAEV